ncbi:MAG: CpaF family protein [Actinomycetia bacterium]|nr:CpaF family protein [Actinomycetes bacterium]MCP4845079.1 CpaF family protein [Actinomycetes bacterium]
MVWQELSDEFNLDDLLASGDTVDAPEFDGPELDTPSAADAGEFAAPTDTPAPPPAPAAGLLGDLFTSEPAQATPPAVRTGSLTQAEQQALRKGFEYERKLKQDKPRIDAANQILRLITDDPEIRERTMQFVLTRDPEVDEGQRADLGALITYDKVQAARIAVGEDYERVFDIVYDELIGVSVLGELWRDDDVTEICVDSWDKVAVERNGMLEETPVRFHDAEHANRVLQQLASTAGGRQVNMTNPLVTAQLPGARIQFVWGELSKAGISVTIRKFRPLLDMNGLLERGALSQEMADFLGACVANRASVVVSGGTGTGKTTMINALSPNIGDERVVTIEDAFELDLSNRFVVNLQSKVRATADDQAGEVTQAALLVAALRMRPDRIIVGEIREHEACAVWLDATNTGHEGGLCSIHANSPESAVNARLTTLLQRAQGGFTEETARHEVATAVDVVVHIARRGGRRFVESISVVDPDEISAGLIMPQRVFEAEISDAGDIEHRFVAPLRSDTDLYERLRHGDADLSTWSK